MILAPDVGSLAALATRPRASGPAFLTSAAGR